MMKGFFVTGTDTGVGKTYVSRLILELWSREIGASEVVGFKPVCCGGREDAEILQAAGNPGVDLDDINPVWLKSPAAPYAASLIENKPVSLVTIMATFQCLGSRHQRVLVEGAGGWEVPVSRESTMANLAMDMGLPVLIVVNNRLGALNHTILTVNAVKASGLECAGIVLNHVEAERDSASISNRALLEEILQVPILADIMHDESEIVLWDG